MASLLKRKLAAKTDLKLLTSGCINAGRAPAYKLFCLCTEVNMKDEESWINWEIT